eukprot:6199374-Pleurochrysis_carterae.AAC.1
MKFIFKSVTLRKRRHHLDEHRISSLFRSLSDPGRRQPQTAPQTARYGGGVWTAQDRRKQLLAPGLHQKEVLCLHHLPVSQLQVGLQAAALAFCVVFSYWPGLIELFGFCHRRLNCFLGRDCDNVALSRGRES